MVLIFTECLKCFSFLQFVCFIWYVMPFKSVTDNCCLYYVLHWGVLRVQYRSNMVI